MRFRDFFLVFIAISLMAIFLNCDPGYKLSVNGTEKKEINFNNSTIEISAISVFPETLYHIMINYDLENDITIHTKAISVEYGKKLIEYSFYGEKGEITDQNYTLTGNNFLLLAFDIRKAQGEKWEDRVAEPGDTIRITAPNFITCNGDTLSLGELILVVGEKVEEKD